MTDFREPYVEGKDNLEQIINALKEGVPVSIEIIIKSYFETEEQYFVIDYRPTLPLALDAETKDEAIKKSKDAIKFLLRNESQDQNLELDLDLLEFKFTIEN